MSAVQDKSAAATKADDAGAAKASVSASAASAAAASKPQSEHQAQWDASGVAISEEDIGIVAYANGVPGFSAVLKQRYSDFIVNEVGRDGQVVRLTTLQPSGGGGGNGGNDAKRARVESGAEGASAAQQQGQEQEEEPKEELGLAARAEKAVAELGAAAGWDEGVRAQLKAELTALVGPEEGAEGQAQGQAQAQMQLVVLPGSEDKALRRAQHQYFKQHFAGLLEGDTVDAPDSAAGAAAKSVRLVRVGQGAGAGRGGAGGPGHWRGYASSGNNRQKRGRDERGGAKSSYDETPKFLRFVLYKENHTTTSAIAALAKQLRIKESRFAFAGMKDKRGLTTQRCSVFRVRGDELLHKVNVQGAGYLRMLVGNVEASDEQLRLGGLGGNRFGVVLRNVEDGVTDAAIAEACEALGRSGFINYFGSQRFGSYGSPTSSIGVAILKRDWAGAVELVLRPRAGEDARCQDARDYWAETKDAKGALALMPRHMSIEQAVLRVLDKQGPQAHLNALQAIPRNLQLMYLHAFQSEVWNKAATHRMQMYAAAHAVQGDLVYVDDAEDEAKEGKEKRVRLVTAEEAAAGSVDIGRVVLPLPGTNIQYPGHGTGALYTQLFAEKGLGMEALRNASQGDYTLGGDYRKLIARPLQFEWRLRRYADSAQRLLPTDVDKLSEEEKARLPAHWQRFLGELVEDGDPEGTMRALCVEFTLAPSTYATMLLRELLKRSMTADERKTMNPAPPAQPKAGGEGGDE